MKRIAMSFRWLTLAFICVINAGPGSSEYTETTTAWSNYPYFVAITDNIGNTLGGGVIISDEFVLTSQDIAFKLQPSDIRVISIAVEKQVSAIFVEEKSFTGHLAVLQVSPKFDLNGTNLSPIDLPNDPAPGDATCSVVGIETKNQEKPANRLHFKNVTTLDIGQCQKVFTTIPDDDLCGRYDWDISSPVACVQSAGDVLLCDGHLTGIASSVQLCSAKTIYTVEVFGDVMYHKVWIIGQMYDAATTEGMSTGTDIATGTGEVDITTEPNVDVTTGQEDFTTSSDSTVDETDNSVIDTTTRHSLATINSYSIALILCSITLMITVHRM